MGEVQQAEAKYPPVGVVFKGGQMAQAPLAENAPTIGYRMNHFMLRIRDPKATLHFYTELMGMRLIWELNTGPFTGYYLGYPETAEHRADPSKYAQDLSEHSTLCHTTGLLELCHFHGSEDIEGPYVTPGHRAPHLGFHHIGFTVPDVSAAVERLKAANVKIVKDIGVEMTDDMPITRWEREEKGLATADVDPKFLSLQAQFAFIEDPDGYLIELVPQTIVLPKR